MRHGHVDRRLKSLFDVIDQQPVLQADVFELIRWAAAYYRHPPGDALFSAVPVALRDGRALQPLRQRFWRLAAETAGNDAAGDESLNSRAPRGSSLRWLELRAAGGSPATTRCSPRASTRAFCRGWSRKVSSKRRRPPPAPAAASSAVLISS